MRPSRAWVLAVAAGTASPVAAEGIEGAEGAAGAAGVELLYHADLDGRLATPLCGKAGAAPPDYAAVAGAIGARRAQAAAAGRAIITLLGGNQVAPDPFSRGLLERGVAGAQALAALFARGGYDAVALGHHELSLRPAVLDSVLQAFAARALPVIATNLRCAVARKALCDATRPELVVRRGDTAVGVLAIVSPGVLPGVPPDHRAGITLEDPVAAIRAAVPRLRARGATRIVLLAQGPRGHDALQGVDALVRRLGTRDAPDIVLAGGLSDEDDGRPIRVLLRQGTPPVAGSSAGAAGLTSVMMPPAGEPGPVTMIPTSTQSIDPETAAWLAPEITGYCARAGVPVAPGPVRGELTRDAFVDYVLEVMRRSGSAEIALVNRSFVKRAAFPIKGTLTRMDLERAIPYPATMGTARLTGAAVEKILAPAARDPRLAVAGLVIAAGGIKVNGRPLDRARSYRVATIGFVASGGDDLLPPDALPWRPLRGTPDVRDAVARFLSSQSAAEDGDATVDPRTDFGPPPEKRTLLVGLTDLGIDLLDTSISNGPGYGDAQLVRARQTSLKGEITALLQLRLPSHEADARFNARYGWTRSQPPGRTPAAAETADLVTLTALYNYRGLRSTASRHLAVPDPYVRASLESEITAPQVTPSQLRDFRHLELTATAGLIFTLSSKLKVRGGAGARHELLAPAPAARWRPVLEAGATLDPVAVATFGALAARLEGLVDYNLVDPSAAREHQLRGSVKVSFPLIPLLFLTAGLDAFAVQRQGLGWGSSYDTTVGLRVHLDAAHQSL